MGQATAFALLCEIVLGGAGLVDLGFWVDFYDGEGRTFKP